VEPPPSNQQDLLERRLRAVTLGAIDMWDAFNVAQYLLGDDDQAPPPHPQGLPTRVKRTLEAGMVITYARPFLAGRGQGLPRLSPAKNLSPELQASHEELLTRRNSVYAHNDETTLRQILEFADERTFTAWLQQPDGTSSEAWDSPAEGALTDLMTLTTRHLERFSTEAEHIRQRLALRRRPA
jgi:hypothetical protein